MNTLHIICLVLLATATYQTIISNLPHNFTPKDEAEYVNYLDIILGNYHETAPLSLNLQKFIQNERPSLFNSPSKIVLLLTALPQNIQNQNKQAFKVNGNELQGLTKQYPNIFEIRNLLNGDQEKIFEQIKKYESEGITVNVINGAQKEMVELERKLSKIKTVSVSAKRRLQGQVTTDSTYLIKFFFSILFVLVIIACVGFISRNDGKKDTLLYAKFIADVGGR